MNSRGILIIILVLIIVVIITLGTILSIEKLSVINPFSSFGGLIQILWTKKEYTTIQNYPKKVVLSKIVGNDNESTIELLDNYMKNRGFSRVNQVGGAIIYNNGHINEVVEYSINRYCSVWIWQ